VRALNVSKTDEGEAVKPSIETVKDGTYPVSRGLQMYTNGEATGNVKIFLNYVMSDEGQKLVEKWVSSQIYNLNISAANPRGRPWGVRSSATTSGKI